MFIREITNGDSSVDLLADRFEKVVTLDGGEGVSGTKNYGKNDTDEIAGVLTSHSVTASPASADEQEQSVEDNYESEASGELVILEPSSSSSSHGG